MQYYYKIHNMQINVMFVGGIINQGILKEE
jgi:hypothetical protein